MSTHVAVGPSASLVKTNKSWEELERGGSLPEGLWLGKQAAPLLLSRPSGMRT